MPPTPYLSSLAELSGWTEGHILAVCGGAVVAGCAATLIVGLRAADAVLEALPRNL
ncbi:hypothetical protein [Nocardioides sp. Soil805]|uniref:hypothetical protein n=1 Tax=Nocardioides sp. Soil805 TaxID=1736416 RepID=UPI000A45D6F5|nr:hypothetical protein [Nocardioides sp. Soil805]